MTVHTGFESYSDAELCSMAEALPSFIMHELVRRLRAHVDRESERAAALVTARLLESAAYVFMQQAQDAAAAAVKHAEDAAERLEIQAEALQEVCSKFKDSDPGE